MARLARVVLPDAPHHITQRGNRRLNVFLEEADYRRYLELLRDCSQTFGLMMAGYCVMTNHVHLIGVPRREDSIAKTLKHCHGMYAAEFNKKYGKTGHLWQARPYSCVLDEAHAWAALRYVERNPVRAGMTIRAEDYIWSSARAHCGLETDPLLTSDWFPTGSIQDWSSWLAEESNSEQEQRIRDRTFTGRPCGDEQFTRQVGAALGRSLEPGKPGRKPHRQRKMANDCYGLPMKVNPRLRA
jgi:REP-associated tyrosine transposase